MLLERTVFLPFLPFVIALKGLSKRNEERGRAFTDLRMHLESQIEPQRPHCPVAGMISERGPRSPGASLLPVP